MLHRGLSEIHRTMVPKTFFWCWFRCCFTPSLGGPPPVEPTALHSPHAQRGLSGEPRTSSRRVHPHGIPRAPGCMGPAEGTPMNCSIFGEEMLRIDTLWWTNILPWKIIIFLWENPLFLWPFSIAMLVHQRVVFFFLNLKSKSMHTWRRYHLKRGFARHWECPGCVFCRSHLQLCSMNLASTFGFSYQNMFFSYQSILNRRHLSFIQSHKTTNWLKWAPFGIRNG